MRLLFAVLMLALVSPCQAETYYLAYWNVENLFDTVDDPMVEGDEDFTPSGKSKWDEERLATKLKALTRIISRMNEGRGPDILGLGEIENREVVELLVKELAPLKRDYKIVHQDSPSSRGIDCAMLVDGVKFVIRDRKFHAVKDVSKPTRDIVEAELTVSGGDVLYVFANHWPSRANPESDRMAAATVLRKRVDEILSENKLADIVLMGDFNDYPPDESITKGLRAIEKLEHDDGSLLNTMWAEHRAGKGSYVYQNKWGVLDQVIVSPGLLDEDGFHWVKDSSQPVIVRREQLYEPAEGIPRPNKTYSGNSYHKTGISDHLPVQTLIER